MMATARYFALYLEQRAELASVFSAIRGKSFDTDATDARDEAVRIVEAALGRSVSDVDRDFAIWFQSDGAERKPVGRVAISGGEPYIANANVNVRTGPSTSYEKLTLIKKGEQIAVFGEEDDWFELRLEGGVTGYAFRRYLDPKIVKRFTPDSE